MSLIPLGQVRLQSSDGRFAQVKCNQDYSAVVVSSRSTSTPGASVSLFTMYAFGSNARVALGRKACIDRVVFASDRQNDWYGKIQVQAPRSADWITAARGDETYILFPLEADGNGQKKLALLNESYNVFVSVRYDEKNPRADDAYPLRTRSGGRVFSGPTDSGTPITNVGSWEKLQLVFEDGTSAARLVLQAAWNNPNISRFSGYRDYTKCDFSKFHFDGMDLTDYSFQEGNLDYADFSKAVSIKGMNVTGASLVGTNFGTHDTSQLIGYHPSAG